MQSASVLTLYSNVKVQLMNFSEFDAPTLALRQFVSNLVRTLIQQGIFTQADATRLLDNWFTDLVAIAAQTTEVENSASLDDLLTMIHSLAVEFHEPPNETPTSA